MISDVLQGGEGQTAIKNAEDLRDLIQRSDFICRIEEDFMYSLQQSRGKANLNQSLFPIQWVGKLMTTSTTTNSSFFSFVQKITENVVK